MSLRALVVSDEGAFRGKNVAIRRCAVYSASTRQGKKFGGEMPTAKKIQEVEELTEALGRSTVVIGAEYRGLTVKETTALRSQLRGAGVEMRVVKNTLFKRAADALGKESMVALAEGPTALIIGFDDPITPIKTVVEYQRTARNTFAARSAYLDGQVFAGSQLTDLATLPSKEVMIAELVGLLQSPVATLVGLLEGTLQEFVGLIDARAEQLGSGSPATPETATAAAASPQPEASEEPAPIAETETPVAEVETPAAEAETPTAEVETSAAEAEASEEPVAEAESSEETPAAQADAADSETNDQTS
jgi:large subunit ribosomal protein L10